MSVVVLTSDHGGFLLKEAMKKHLTEKGISFEDLGPPNADSIDYPPMAAAACQKIVDGTHDKGLFFCGTGIGMSMAANKTHGIRAAVCSDYFSAKATRQHNNANVLCLGERVVGTGLAAELIDVFLATDFQGGRHQQRIDLLSKMEEKY